MTQTGRIIPRHSEGERERERNLGGSEDDFEKCVLLTFIYLLYVYFLELAFDHVPVCACERVRVCASACVLV